ncbi:MAG: hypothetical protein LZF60_330028 [Nitrospira sp.]|nr:MAG: hypothetical protein LZF60_330028 [Nitrospira sp.]
MRMWPITGILTLVLLSACTTPPEIKQALATKDHAYAENERLMQQYRELVSRITTRHQLWYRYVQTRLKLNLALQWATTNPRLIEVADPDLAQDDAALLGPDVMAVVNHIRLKSLPERKGPTGQPVFMAGTGDMSNLVQNLPELISTVERLVEQDAKKPAALDLSAFDRYRTNVQALRRINGTIKHYLDIDVTLDRGEVQSLAEALQQTGRSLR